MEDQLGRIRVVLVGTSHPGNIGSVARAMKAMGLSDLVLVDPQRFPAAEATALAAGADDLLARARVLTRLEDAVADCVWVVGTSARRRGHSVPVFDPEPAARELIARASGGSVALVFGRESSGLTNAELDRCTALVQIPTDPGFSSLNLAAAVQVLAYACRTAALVGDSGSAPGGGVERHATQAEMEALFEHYQRVLVQIEFLDPEKPRHLMRRLRHLYQRAGLTANEVRILRGILTHTERGGGRPRTGS
ncbi:tRNA:Cm32/Um32 methyltransferase [Thioalkalivibrio nitratireducens DSM 14787]|uniref:tRNA (cytidine/uridine-2'-O-)-methyltransferase TrmJ n=1 Tax=Thioalkalivibrio nitratireducens (strain DSM 14787 / UNIQEM 213 / ALEN2) TaxID=1255043 RepID=L0DSG8_THIND|nr:RNA methyltransferase [Thioalkalivibrio nitratireducens]AGA32559.1 tRNA:Cm32/Um32 methyltransferase [Thioalkalivibrio nitratireducens DSM 14787]